MHEMVAGSLAGLAAMAPMTLTMEGLFTQLPKHHQYPLPPQQITERMASAVDLDDDLSEPALQSASMVAHFGYGAAAGAIYGAIGQRLMSGPAGGAAFGLAVWTVSYLGWLPAVNLLPPATRTPATRNGLMIAAHLVWGLALGYGTQKLLGNRRC